ncbi:MULTISPECIES: reverse transcriptase domain-containing protein [Exiguobacterium]|uniref:reverse transcriptase domain-containing protein n=1 Tax=Exiguobacterium TaxID=33986 RepID=UPI0007D85E04|nr:MULTISPECIES: reverse transcriptase domain-containing protein [Exiguobacterium]OAI88959.1 hypothetical protein AYO36_02095 [Exiguobacterium sp. KKBO11]
METLERFKNYHPKNYLHIDRKIFIGNMYTPTHNKTIRRRAFELIQDKEYVQKHAFLPFIHYSIDLKKYTFIEGHNNKTLKVLKTSSNEFNQGQYKYIKPKKREIYYASHFDSYIYKYYGELLNMYYNDFAIKYNIDECSIAYRDNKKGKNNIHFSKEVFEFILKQKNALIIALDFSSFFDNISHDELKKSLKQLLNVGELPADIYNVFKSITKFRYLEKEDLDRYLLSIKNEKDIDIDNLIQEKQIKNYMSMHTFRNLIKSNQLKVYPETIKTFGIPQGSGVSSVCSNIRLIKFDIEMNEWTKKLNGLYRRYCDDLIWIIPDVDEHQMDQIKNEIYEKISRYKDLKLQKEKTILLSYSDRKMTTLEGQSSKLDYLGFVFDGNSIKIREKSLFKYYNRAYRKTRVLAKKHHVYNRNAYMKSLYGLYTHLGMNYKGYGNFISYSYKAEKIMKALPVDVQIRQQVKRHWYKVNKRLKDNKEMYGQNLKN